VEVVQDSRPSLLNDDTKDTLDGVQFKRAIVRDYLLYGSAYAFINKKSNKFKSLNYVARRNISIISSVDPIFKDYNINVIGKQYRPFEFLKILRATEDGARGVGLIEENKELLNIAYTTLLFEKNLVSTGGNKKGFLQAKNRISTESMTALKTAWRNLYSNNQENMMILNDGLTFQEASSTSVEMQLNESKKSDADAILGIFGIPADKNYELFIKQAIMPILTAIECALNRDFLLEREKNKFYFAFDTKEITKGDIKTRFEAYKTALDSNLMQIDEVRYMEDLEPLGLNFIKLGLQDVLYNPQTKEVFTPNTGQKTSVEKIEYVNENKPATEVKT
jgi:HK97 family phage portal protein